MRIVRYAVVVMLVVGCGPKAMISETRMIQAAPREPNCSLELVTVDITAMTFNQTWEVLGYVTFTDTGTQDPTAEENRKLVRPRACAMGGTSIALGMNSTNTTQLGQQGSGIMYMVLRPKSATPPPPTAF
jgi:hypothetical protein